uniref:Rab-GAP TBC domain-containing protein n=1 Tax=Brassica campestris TaxID=3711 RepID=A0A3P6AXR5_BRACM|nr:unnamed protein product [Brassica rapa]
MLKDRGYNIEESDIELKREDFVQNFCKAMNKVNKEALFVTADKGPNPEDKIYVLYPEGPKVGVPIIKKDVVMKMRDDKVTRGIIVVPQPITGAAKNAIIELNKILTIEVFEEAELVTNIAEHKLINKYYVLDNQAKKELLQEYTVQDTQLPRILVSDPVGLTDYEDLEPCRILHAARLVAILEAYAVFDPEIGYCQGMSDLLSPLLAVIEDDAFAFWCFVGFMSKARHNFRLDEVGIRRQLSMVSKIIQFKDIRLYRHLENLEAEDCFFVYRMVVVMFRRELTFEQTLCLWEVMWADQAAIRTGIAKATWGRIRLRAPPTEDLLLYAIAASVLQRRKTIIEKYSGMDEIMKECNSMAGRLDVWKLLDDAHDLVVNLHDKI